MPISLAYFAGALRMNGFECNIIDAFGDEPNHCWIEGDVLLRGLTPSEVANSVDTHTQMIVIYASNLSHHCSLVKIVQVLRPRFPKVPIIIMENTQAVTAYSVRRVQEELYAIGVDYVITGEAEERGIELLRALRNGVKKQYIQEIDGVGYKENGITYYTPPQRTIPDLDGLPFPAWDLFPLRNYWRLKYAHGPFATRKYLPILTSRGCPYSCTFCVIPETNDMKWRARSAGNVVDELEQYSAKFGVQEFHIEDVDPTVKDKRIRDICKEIIHRNLDVIWKICAGTKAETIRDETTVELMAKAGCRYISISPETGSRRLLKMINKPFNLGHTIQMVKKMNEVGIYSQACFVLGYPGENDEDRQMTRNLVHELTKAGVDEIALFIITPVPGSAIFEQFAGYTDVSELTFSPNWRQDYKKLNKFRLNLYRSFLLWKLQYHPRRIAKQPINFLRRKFQTKMEMTPYRALHTTLLKTGLTGKRINNEN